MPADSKAAKTFRDNVLSLIASRGTTITDLAIATGMSRPGISRVLHGKEDVTLTRAAKIAAYFDKDLTVLLRPQKTSKQSA